MLIILIYPTTIVWPFIAFSKFFMRVRGPRAGEEQSHIQELAKNLTLPSIKDAFRWPLTIIIPMWHNPSRVEFLLCFQRWHFWQVEPGGRSTIYFKKDSSFYFWRLYYIYYRLYEIKQFTLVLLYPKFNQRWNLIAHKIDKIKTCVNDMLPQTSNHILKKKYAWLILNN